MYYYLDIILFLNTMEYSSDKSKYCGLNTNKYTGYIHPVIESMVDRQIIIFEFMDVQYKRMTFA